MRQRHGGQHLTLRRDRDTDDVRLLAHDIGEDAAAEDAQEHVMLLVADGLEQAAAAVHGRGRRVAQQIERGRIEGQRRDLEALADRQESLQPGRAIQKGRTAHDADRLLDLGSQLRPFGKRPLHPVARRQRCLTRGWSSRQIAQPPDALLDVLTRQDALEHLQVQIALDDLDAVRTQIRRKRRQCQVRHCRRPIGRKEQDYFHSIQRSRISVATRLLFWNHSCSSGSPYSTHRTLCPGSVSTYGGVFSSHTPGMRWLQRG